MHNNVESPRAKIVIAAISSVGIIIAAYIGYVATIKSTILPIEATQTAETLRRAITEVYLAEANSSQPFTATLGPATEPGTIALFTPSPVQFGETTYTSTSTLETSDENCSSQTLYTTDDQYTYESPGGGFSNKRITIGEALTCIKSVAVQGDGSEMVYLYVQDSKGSTYWVTRMNLVNSNPRHCFSLKTSGIPEKKGYLYFSQSYGWSSTSYSLDNAYLKDLLGGTIDVSISNVDSIRVSKSVFILDMLDGQYPIMTSIFPATQAVNEYTMEGGLMFISDDGIKYAVSTWRNRDSEVQLVKTSCD